MADPTEQATGAFRTIGEVAAETGLPQHILRYWETKFPELRPLQRAGNRRYYRPADVVLVKRIDQLLNREGYTVRGVQQLLAQASAPMEAPAPVAAEAPPPPPAPARSDDRTNLQTIRDMLALALMEDTPRTM